MSTYKPESDISKVNSAAGLHPVKVHSDLILAVKKSLEFADISGGAFNIAIGPAIDLWNITESEVIPSPAELAAIKPLIDYKNVVVNEKEGTIFLRKKGMRINLGGIGKGFAADYAYNVLKTYGIRSGIIAIAGDLRAIIQCIKNIRDQVRYNCHCRRSACNWEEAGWRQMDYWHHTSAKTSPERR